MYDLTLIIAILSREGGVGKKFFGFPPPQILYPSKADPQLFFVSSMTSSFQVLVKCPVHLVCLVLVYYLMLNDKIPPNVSIL